MRRRSKKKSYFFPLKIKQIIKNKKFLIFFILIPFIAISQYTLLYPHLQFGFGDVDWGFLSYYIMNKTQHPNFFSNVWTAKNLGVYMHQAYYIGLQWELFKLNFFSYQLTTHIFKIIGILAMFPVFFILSDSLLVASIGVIIYAFSFAAVGTMYTTVTSSDYSALLTLGIFLWLYIKHLKNELQQVWFLAVLFFLFILSIYLSTERMVPVVLAIFLIDVLFLLRSRTKKSLLRNGLRIIVLFLPVFLAVAFRPNDFLGFLFNNGSEIISRILKGDWNLLLTPFTVLGGTIIPYDKWPLFGEVHMAPVANFLQFFLFGPFLILSIATFLFWITTFKKHFKLLLTILICFFLSSFPVYILAVHQFEHFDIGNVVPSLIGVYLLIMAFAYLFLAKIEKNRLFFGIWLGIVFALFYIIVTWSAAATRLIFVGPHRYLTIPAIGISFAIACLLVQISKNLAKTSFKPLRVTVAIPTILVIILLFWWVQTIEVFFSSQLINGFGAYDKQLMRNQLTNQIPNLSSKNPSLFSFDLNEDKERGYYYDNTLLAGFPSWMLWNKNINFNMDIAPILLWNKPELLPKIVTIKNGVKGFLYNEKFYLPQDFYAFKLKDKKVINITNQTLASLSF